MDEYISRSAAINASRKIGKREYDAGKTETAVISMLINDELRAIPASDVVKVVRCSNCWKRGLDNCPMEFYWDGHSQEDDCFCKFGEVDNG